MIYTSGVDNKKFAGRKPSAADVEVVTKANKQEEFVAREEVYDKLRLEIQYQFKLVTYI